MKTDFFSGKKSKNLWKTINKISRQKKRKKIAKATANALYSLGCKCQEFETRVKEFMVALCKKPHGGI